MMKFDFFTLQALKQQNDLERNELLANASEFDSDYDKIHYICDRFFNEYSFDYSVLRLRNGEELEDRRPYFKSFTHKGKRFICATMKSQDVDMKHGLTVSPSIHTLKMGTCFSFTTELQWFAKEFGIDYEIKNEPLYCYDGYQTVKAKDEIRKILHYYMIMNLDGKGYKVDVAGALMAKDYKRKHPDAEIESSDFLFVEPNKENPFDALLESKTEKGEE